jgi:hypothetical protein
VESADAPNNQRAVARLRRCHQSMMSAQASSGTATTLPTTGTVLTTAAEIRHGAARTLQPERVINRIADISGETLGRRLNGGLASGASFVFILKLI